jgi:small conductance mechanosensitive channel
MFKLIPLALAQAATDTVTEETQGIAKMIEFVIRQFPLWIAAIMVFALSVVLAKVTKRWVENKIAEKGIEEEHKGVQILAGRMASAGMLTMGITSALKIAGIDITTIIAAVAFGIGFALRDLIMNFLAGVMILVSRHFTIGDFIKVNNDIVGKIVEIQTRATVLEALDGTKVVVPNADLFTNVVTSFTSNAFRRIEILVGVDYGTDLKLAIDKCNEALKKTEGILAEPEPMVIFDEFADSSINIKVRGWVESRSGWLNTKSDLVIAIKAAFDEAGISIPWPIRTIYHGDNAGNEKKLEQGVKETMATRPAPVPTPEAAPAPTPAPQPQPQLQPQEQEVQNP